MRIFRRILWASELVRQLSDPLLLEDMSVDSSELAGRNWMYPDGYLTHVMVPFLDSEEEMEVEIDESAQIYRFHNPMLRSQIFTRPLVDITLYAFRWDAVLDHLSQLAGIEPRFAGRRKCLITDHLWYLGDVRIGDSHAFVPVFWGRLLSRAPASLLVERLADPIYRPDGVILALRDLPMTLPNGHRIRAIDDFLIAEKDTERFDREAFDRVLRGLPADALLQPEEWFDEKTGQLKLKHLPHVVTFTGIQKKIIGIFWKARNDAPLTWADVKRQSDSAAKTIDRAFGKDDPWTDWLERTGHGRLRIRAGSSPKIDFR